MTRGTLITSLLLCFITNSFSYIPINPEYNNEKCSFHGKYIENDQDQRYCECTDGYLGEFCEIDDSTRRLFSLTWEKSAWSYLILVIYITIIMFIAGSVLSWGDVKDKISTTMIHIMYRRYINPIIITPGIINTIYFLCIMEKLQINNDLYNDNFLGPNSRTSFYALYIVLQLEPLWMYIIIYIIMDSIICCKNDASKLRNTFIGSNAGQEKIQEMIKQDTIPEEKENSRCSPPGIGYYLTKNSLYTHATFLTTFIVDFAMYDKLFEIFDYTDSKQKYWAIVSCAIYWSRSLTLFIFAIPYSIFSSMFYSLSVSESAMIKWKTATKNPLTKVGLMSQIMDTMIMYPEKMEKDAFTRRVIANPIAGEKLEINQNGVDMETQNRLKSFELGSNAPQFMEPQDTSVIERMKKKFMNGVMAKSPDYKTESVKRTKTNTLESLYEEMDTSVKCNNANEL